MALMVGAAVGSFLNMVIYRLPRRLSFVDPPKSFCPKCRHSLGPIDLFPLFSWLSTGGKCRYCKAPIAVRYFLVEVFCGGLFAGLWWQYLIVGYDPLRMVFYMAATACLVAIIFIDWELYIIPDEINALLLAIGVGMQFALNTPEVALWGALWGWGILWGIAFLGRLLFRKDAMGHGDIKMMRGVGAIIGSTLLIANMAIAVVSGLVIGLALIAYSKSRPAAAPQPSLYDDEAEAILAELCTPEQVRSIKADCEQAALPWQDVARDARKAKVESYEALMKLYEPESIGSLLKFGLFYLLCLDIVGVFWHGIYRAVGEEYLEENVEDDTWTPSLTTIPFGPYLAIGALACMIFAAPIEHWMKEYWDTATGAKNAISGTVSPNNFTKMVDFREHAA
jgi:leader peptidase (prepilin peptidase)/N-methyltransferase